MLKWIAAFILISFPVFADPHFVKMDPRIMFFFRHGHISTERPTRMIDFGYSCTSKTILLPLDYDPNLPDHKCRLAHEMEHHRQCLAGEDPYSIESEIKAEKIQADCLNREWG